MNNELERVKFAGGIRERQAIALGKEVGTGHWTSCIVHAYSVGVRAGEMRHETLIHVLIHK
jgi:hypothetical protein